MKGDEMLKKGQEKVEQILHDIKEQVNLEEKAPPTSKLWNNLSMGISALACVIFIVYFIVYFAVPAENIFPVLNAFNFIFFIEIALIVPAASLAIRELCRNIFLSSVLSIVLCLLAVVCITIFMIITYQRFGFTLFTFLSAIRV